MLLTMLKSKVHRATVTDADLEYEGSISIDTAIIEAAGFLVNEQVHIYNCNAGSRFSTYVIPGKKGEICLNGAAARHVQRGDKVIICSYAQFTPEEAKNHTPIVIGMGEGNSIK